MSECKSIRWFNRQLYMDNICPMTATDVADKALLWTTCLYVVLWSLREWLSLDKTTIRDRMSNLRQLIIRTESWDYFGPIKTKRRQLWRPSKKVSRQKYCLHALFLDEFPPYLGKLCILHHEIWKVSQQSTFGNWSHTLKSYSIHQARRAWWLTLSPIFAVQQKNMLLQPLICTFVQWSVSQRAWSRNLQIK